MCITISVLKLIFFSFSCVYSDMGALSSTSPNENTAESPPSNEFDNKISVEQVPKPRKFFKSRNSAPSTEVIAQQQQQQMQAQQPSNNSYQNQQIQQESYKTFNQHSQSSSSEDDRPAYPTQQPTHQEIVKRGKKKTQKPEKAKPPPKPKPEKKVKVPVVKPPPKVQQAPPSRPSRNNDPATRSSGRTRAKCVNYNEDADEADFIRRTERRVAPRHLQQAPTSAAPQAESPSADAAHPPIVLRISKASLTICALARNYIEHFFYFSSIPPFTCSALIQHIFPLPSLSLAITD